MCWRSWRAWRAERLASHGVVVGGRRVEVGVEGHLGVDHDVAPADEVHNQVGTLGSVGKAHLLGEVAAVDQARQLDRAAQVELAPAAPDLGLAQGGGEGPGLAGQVGDLLVELPLPGGAVLVEVAHLVAEAVEPLHHLGLVDHAGGVRRPAARPEQAQAAAEDQAEDERECERGQDLHGHEHGPGHRQPDGDAAMRTRVGHNRPRCAHTDRGPCSGTPRRWRSGPSSVACSPTSSSPW